MDINKLILQTFNYLTYNYKINKLFIANILLNLVKFYIFNKIIKKINL